MRIIEKQNEFISDEKHLEYLLILKKCQENYINGKSPVSKKMYLDMHKSKTKESMQDDIRVLNEINYNISLYK